MTEGLVLSPNLLTAEYSMRLDALPDPREEGHDDRKVILAYAASMRDRGAPSCGR
jgi:hypothetical protein